MGLIKLSDTHTHTHTHTLNEGLAGHRELYLNTDSAHVKQTSMHPAGFEPAIPAGEEVTLFQRDETYKRMKYSQALSLQIKK